MWGDGENKNGGNGVGVAHDIGRMFQQAFKNIDDVLWKEAGCTTELDYTEQTSWLLFLKYLDALEADKAMEAELEGHSYGPRTRPPQRLVQSVPIPSC